MTVRVSKPAFNVRDKLSELDKPVGLKGTELMRSETIQDARNLIGAGRKNLIINGAMQVAQRKPSGEYTGQAAYATVDRMMGSYSVPNTDPITEAHVLTSGDVGPWAEGFRKSYRMKIGYQGTASAGHFYQFQYRIEGHDMVTSGWDYTSSTSYITLSFWIKSSVSYNPSWYFRAKDGTAKIYRWQPGMLVANTWTKVTKTIPGDSGLTIDNDNGEGFQINLSPYWGTTYSSSNPTMDSWENWDSASRTKDTDPIWFETNGTTTEITGLQLEVGSSATKFEHLPYAEDLRRCQRYYEGIKMGTGTALFRTWTNTAGSPSNVSNAEYNFKVEKRATPTWTVEGNASWYPSGTSGMSAYPSTSMCLFQRNDTNHQFFSDANGDLCGSFSCEL